MFKRELASSLRILAQTYPSLAVLGPRQSGKTTLVKATFPDYIYLSLEDRVVWERASVDPKGFLNIYKNSPGIILDEFQNLPVLLSYIQGMIDEEYKPGFFILTGSQNFLVNQAISQSLAGRIALVTLLPLSISEMSENNILPDQSETAVYTGCYPRIYAQKMNPTGWYNDYLETYVEKDIRQITQITNLNTFKKFVGLCAGRIGQVLNITTLSNDCGVSATTVKSWLSVLEASYIIFFLQPYYENFGKRLIKSPKLYFYDSGLACSLLGITSDLQLNTHYLRGALFESFVISEICKQFYNRREKPRTYFWHDAQCEIDCLVEKSNKIIPIEIKSSETITQSFFNCLIYWNDLSKTKTSDNFLIYSGSENLPWPRGNVVSWKNIQNIFE